MKKQLFKEFVYEFKGEFVPSILAKMSPADRERFRYLRLGGGTTPLRGCVIMDICDKDGVYFDDFGGLYHHSVIGRRVSKIKPEVSP